jgi:DnaJ domain
MSLSDDPRAILGVGYGAGVDEIRAAYRVAAKRAHPDLGGSSEAFRRVRTAADVLIAQLQSEGLSGADRHSPDADRTSRDGHWMDISDELRTIWGLTRKPVTIFGPQKIGLSPFVTGMSLNAPAYRWLIRNVGPRGEHWDFHIIGSVVRLFFRHADDARQFQLRFV